MCGAAGVMQACRICEGMQGMHTFVGSAQLQLLGTGDSGLNEPADTNLKPPLRRRKPSMHAGGPRIDDISPRTSIDVVQGCSDCERLRLYCCCVRGSGGVLDSRLLRGADEADAARAHGDPTEPTCQPYLPHIHIRTLKGPHLPRCEVATEESAGNRI